MTDNTIHPQIIRHGLNALLNLPAGVRDAITHIGLSTARFIPTAETSSVPDEVLRIAISDAIDAGDNAIQFYAAIGDGEWTGNMTAIYTVAFYLSTGTLLAVWSNPSEVEALLRKGRSEEFYYTFALDALPADKIEIISTERVFNHTLPDINLSLFSASINRRNALEQQYQNGLISVRAGGWKSDGYMTELETDHASFALAGIHTHANIAAHAGSNWAYTLGLPEQCVFIAGEIQYLRHVDTTLVKPKVGGAWLETEPVKAPAIPDAVKNQPTPALKIAEAKQWVKAAVNNDHNIRDFRPHAKTILVYLESWRQKLDASTYDASLSVRHGADVTDPKAVTQTAALKWGLGYKGVFENDNSPVITIENGVPAITNWRMLCTELGTLADYPAEQCVYHNYDPAIDCRTKSVNAETLEDSVYAHFAVKYKKADTDYYGKVNNGGLLNQWMQTVPGLSNGKDFKVTLSERFKKSYTLRDPDETKVLNAGFYTNYASIPKDATGRTLFRFGWKNPTKWVAVNDQPDVVGYKDPTYGYEYKWSEACPWEFVELHWFNNTEFNPYDISYIDNKENIIGDGLTPETAFSGWNEDHFGWLLPLELFDDEGVADDTADTGAGSAWVMCGDGVARQMVCAGMRIFTLPFEGKKRRTRYPIMPLAHHGNPLYQWMRSERLQKDADLDSLSLSMINLQAQVALDKIDASELKKPDARLLSSIKELASDGDNLSNVVIELQAKSGLDEFETQSVISSKMIIDLSKRVAGETVVATLPSNPTENQMVEVVIIGDPRNYDLRFAANNAFEQTEDNELQFNSNKRLINFVFSENKWLLLW